MKVNGFKTYIILAIAFLSYISMLAGWLSWEQFIQLIPLLGIGSGFAIRDAIKKCE